MSKKEMDIEELIADARAEEEVAAEQERAAKEEKAREDFRDTLREQLKEALIPKDENKVTINVSEYLILKQKEADLDRILNAIVDGLGLNYSKDALKLGDSDNVVSAIRVLYPDVYDALLAAELENVEG
jgi:predicted P-loop ATPase/GTPase